MIKKIIESKSDYNDFLNKLVNDLNQDENK
jgi:hypothetical protein